MAKFTGVTPPTFSGRANEDADDFIRSFERYLTFRDITDNNKKLNLFGVLLHDAAAQWLDAVPDSGKNSFDHLLALFTERYRLPESLKFKCANDLFSRKQQPNESVDDYVTAMRKTARLIQVDENILKLVLVNGFKPWIAAQVTQARPESIDKILDVARLAEITAPTTESTVNQQLVDMCAEMRRLSTKVDQAITASVQSPRSPTPERRVHFEQPQSSTQHQSHSHNTSFYPPGLQQSFYNQQPQTTTWFRQRPPTTRSYTQPRQPPQQQNEPNRQPLAPCNRCARQHGKNEFCPARDPSKYCYYCHKPGHFQAACFSAPKQY